MTLLTLATALLYGTATVQPDTVAQAAADTLCVPPSPVSAADTSCAHASSVTWIKQLWDNGFLIHDPTVCYPAFPRFALGIYNWADRTFNSYDSGYVVGTGKNWKLMGKSYNWLEASSMLYPHQAPIAMRSDVYSDAGFSLSFMAVSIGYMWNINKTFSDPVKRRTFNFDFTTSRFAVSFQSMSSDGGMIITRFGSYNDGHSIHYKFDDCSTSIKTVDAYWFFNNYRYSQGAAYSYSKYQLRSAGTPIVGFNFVAQHNTVDFAFLPMEMLQHSPTDDLLYTSRYRSYCMLGGYGYNWVLKPGRWLINATAMVALGYKKLIDSEEQHDAINQLANNYRLNLACVYNHRALFAALTVRGNAYANYTKTDITHLNSFISFTGLVGLRF